MGNLLWDGLFKLVFMNNLLPKSFCVDLKIYFVCIYEKMGKINFSVLDVISVQLMWAENRMRQWYIVSIYI